METLVVKEAELKRGYTHQPSAIKETNLLMRLGLLCMLAGVTPDTNKTTTPLILVAHYIYT
ncbi:MAG: hypothetical protein JKY52_07230 [Flavobacteriales bacterium]|nr:hypothetical protein [Flavobacteriales bacterium]